MEKNRIVYTAGVFAKKAGITLKTIHHYDKEGLLSPSEYNEAGYRLYSEEDFVRLQKILTLKFLGFSLEEIKQMIKSDRIQNNVKQSLAIQREIIDEKIKHLSLVKKAITEAENMIHESDDVNWNRFTDIIKVINMEKIWMNQYKNAANLSARIRLHDLFSTNKYGWHRWLFDQLGSLSGLKVLELGCGNASLWVRNSDRIPKDCDITLTDLSEGMLEDAKQSLNDYPENFTFSVVDAQNIPFADNSFDMVIANHMLYHVSDRPKTFSEINRVLKPGGSLYASTIGKKHLFELKQLLKEFHPGIIISESDFSEEFGLENGSAQLSAFFNDVELLRYEDSLVVTDAAPLVGYVCSTTGNTKQLIVNEKLSDFKKFVNNRMESDGHVFITKDTGVFKSKKY